MLSEVLFISVPIPGPSLDLVPISGTDTAAHCVMRYCQHLHHLAIASVARLLNVFKGKEKESLKK